MKCPFRKKTTVKDGVTTEEFEDCYGENCHAYSCYGQCTLSVGK